MHLEPFAIVVVFEILQEEEGVGVDGGVCVWGFACFPRFGQFDEDGFAGGGGGFNAWAPEFLTFAADFDDGAVGVLSACIVVALFLLWRRIFGGVVASVLIIIYFALRS